MHISALNISTKYRCAYPPKAEFKRIGLKQPKRRYTELRKLRRESKPLLFAFRVYYTYVSLSEVGKIDVTHAEARAKASAYPPTYGETMDLAFEIKVLALNCFQKF